MTTQQMAEIEETRGDEHAEADAAPEGERRRIEEQLAALERKQAELRRALAMADHPQLADAIREIEGRAYAVGRAEARLAQPLSKSEERQRAKLESKLEAARAKRAEHDAQIASLEAELSTLTDERVARLRTDRDAALEVLFGLLARHADAFDAAGLQMAALVPELERWLPDLRAMAEARLAADA